MISLTGTSQRSRTGRQPQPPSRMVPAASPALDAGAHVTTTVVITSFTSMATSRSQAALDTIRCPIARPVCMTRTGTRARRTNS